MANPFHVLGIAPESLIDLSHEQIFAVVSARYRTLASCYHPDQGVIKSAAKMMELADAYAKLNLQHNQTEFIEHVERFVKASKLPESLEELLGKQEELASHAQAYRRRSIHAWKTKIFGVVQGSRVLRDVHSLYDSYYGSGELPKEASSEAKMYSKSDWMDTSLDVSIFDLRHCLVAASLTLDSTHHARRRHDDSTTFEYESLWNSRKPFWDLEIFPDGRMRRFETNEIKYQPYKGELASDEIQKLPTPWYFGATIEKGWSGYLERTGELETLDDITLLGSLCETKFRTDELRVRIPEVSTVQRYSETYLRDETQRLFNRYGNHELAMEALRTGEFGWEQFLPLLRFLKPMISWGCPLIGLRTDEDDSPVFVYLGLARGIRFLSDEEG